VWSRTLPRASTKRIASELGSACSTTSRAKLNRSITDAILLASCGCGHRAARADHRRCRRPASLARAAPRVGWGLARAPEEGRHPADQPHLRRGAGGGPLLRVDRRPGPRPRPDHAPAALHAAAQTELLV